MAHALDDGRQRTAVDWVLKTIAFFVVGATLLEVS